jgi:hypothetical protein
MPATNAWATNGDFDEANSMARHLNIDVQNITN